MKVYISGAISNDPDYRAKFAEAESFLRSLGHVVINPAKKPEGLSYKEYIDLGLAELSKCDAIFMLPDGFKSEGAKLEHRYAQTVGILIYYDNPNIRRCLKRQYKNEKRREKMKVNGRIPWEAD